MSSPPDPAPPGNPPLPWRARLLVSAASVLHSVSLRDDGTVNRALLSLFDRAVPPSPVPDAAGVSSSDHAVSGNSLRVRLFLPSPAGGSQPPLPVVVYFHGGGFVFHSAASARFDALCRRLAASIPAAVASVDYRLAPEHKHPAAYDDGEAALRWALAGAGGALPPSSSSAPVFLAGDSAGGNIAHHVAARLPNRVSGLVLLQPFFGGESPTASEQRLRDAPFGAPGRLAWLWRAFLPPGAARGHEAADVPAAIAAGALARAPFPATLVCVGGRDAHQDRQRAYARALRDAAGAGAEENEVRVAEFPDAVHAFYLFEELADSKRALAEVREFVNRRAAQHMRKTSSPHE